MKRLSTITSCCVHATGADWNSVEQILDHFSMDSRPAFHLHISKEKGREVIVKLELPAGGGPEEGMIKCKPIEIPAGLYDLGW